MAEVKRLNYFNSQFLKEKDFQDEQAYHIQMRRLQNQRLHSWGIIYGLDVSQVGNTEVSVTAGMAIDKDGREIFLPPDPPPSNFNLSSFTGNAVVYLTIAYGEVFDPGDRNPGGSGDQFVRTTERPKREVKADAPPTDGSVIILAKVTLNNGKVTADGINLTVRSPFVSSAIAPNSITLDKLAPSLRPTSIDGVSNPGGDINLIATNAITINPNDPSNQITIGESHSVRTDNPHGITAGQVGAIPATGGTITGGELTLKGTADDAGDIIFTDSANRQKGRIWTNPAAGDSGMYLSSGDNNPDIAIDKDGKVGIGIGTATPGAKLQVSGGQTILEQEPWQTPALQSGWAPYGNGYNPPAYFKDSMGIVHLRGMVTNGTLQSAIFTLPVGYRPANRELLLVGCFMPNPATRDSGFGRVDVASDGQVIAWEGRKEWLSLDGITFRAEALGRVFNPRDPIFNPRDPIFINPRDPVVAPIGRINVPGGLSG